MSEKRLIDANALKQRFDEREADDVEMYGVHISECFPADDAKEIVDKMPTIDAVEVVRCKDCKFWRDDIIRDDDEMKCCSIGMYMTNGSNFCSFGKRREEDV